VDLIICTNCGSVNADDEGRVCRKCGAFLPISSKAPRLKISSNKKKPKTHIKGKEKKKSEIKIPNNANLEMIGETNIFYNKKTEKSKKQMQLQEIPKQDEVEIKDKKKDYYIPEKTEKSKQILEEIEPIPYDGSILSIKKASSGTLITEQKEDEIKIKKKVEKEKKSESKEITVKKQLEKDMIDVLGFLSEKLDITDNTMEEAVTKKKEKKKEEIKPESMNEILKNLLNIDINVEASAIIKNDGTILASAISDRISDSLFATVGQNLSMIGSDIVNGLSAGELYSIAIRGSEGVLHLAPLEQENSNLKNMILIIFSHPKVKSGIINIAKNLVNKQVKQYLGIK